MKPLVTLTLICCIFFACQKEVQNLSYLQRVRSSLQDSLPAYDFDKLDFNHAILSAIDSLDQYFIRVPYKGKCLANDFVLVHTNRQGSLKIGKIIHLEKKAKTESTLPVGWEGTIAVSSLNRQSNWVSEVHHGFIKAYHSQEPDFRTSVLMNEMPEIIVVAYVNNSLSYSEWITLQGLLYNPIGGGGTYYSDLNGTSGSTSYGGLPTTTVYQVDADTYINNPAIDLEKYLHCFDKISDVNAICSIELFTDIPVDKDPYKLFDLGTQFPGHTFFQIKKSSNGQSVIQNIGFYPSTNWKSILTTAPITGKFVDDSQHEFNASIKMNISPEKFQSILTEIRYLARFIKYDVDEYNCTDFALDIFNKARSFKLNIPMIDIPGGITSGGSRTPQGLFLKLKEMKASNDPEAVNINIGFAKGWVSVSNGACD